MEWVLWAIVAAALVHVAEEHWGGWLNWVRQRVPGVTLFQFAAINAIFILGCVVGAVVGARSPVLSLSVASLVFVNALIHIAPALCLRRYTPGLVSAALYLPLSVGAYLLAARSWQLTVADGVKAALLGLFWMALPLGFQGTRLGLERMRNRRV